MKKYFILLLIGVSSILYTTPATMAMECTQEAKLCSDGVTSVGRTGPNCEFAACPDEVNYLSVVSKNGLSVSFQSLIGDFYPSRPSYTDGQDTVIDFGDGSQHEWLHCSKSDTTTSTNLCATPIKISHNYASSGTYEAKILQEGGDCIGGTCPVTILSSVSVTVSENLECTEEAKLCSDGVTYVGRTGPNCEFEACPGDTAPKACARIYNPVCGQPIMPACPQGLACIQVMPNPQTYANTCTMENASATLVHKGKCVSDYDQKVVATLDTKMQTLIQKIDDTFSTISGKMSIVNKMIDLLNQKYEQKPLLQGLIRYMIDTLQNYLDTL